MGEDMLRVALIAVTGLALACQGPPATTLHSVEPTERPVVPICESLAPLADAFDARMDVPRVVALLPARCERCGLGFDALERSVLRAFPRERLHVFVVLPAGERCEACGAAAQRDLDDPRLTLFRDTEGAAARAFARGILPLARAQDVYLLYPSGVRWPRPGQSDMAAVTPTERAQGRSASVAHGAGSAAGAAQVTGEESNPETGPPRADEWWHRLGRVAPERHCTDLELEGTLRAAMARLVEQGRGGAGPGSPSAVVQQ